MRVSSYFPLFCVIGGIPYSNAFFGAGTGPIYLDDVACTSSSTQLLECPSSPISSHNCLHSADAGVGCEGNIFWNKDFANVAAKRAVLRMSSLQLHAHMVSCDWWEVTFQMKAEWRSV